MGDSRRACLRAVASVGLAGLAGCQEFRTQPALPTTPPDPPAPTVRRVNQGPPGFVLENDQVALRLNPTTNAAPIACHAFAPIDASPRLRPIRSRPKTPISKTDSVAPTPATNTTGAVLTGIGSDVAYQVRRRHALADTPIDITWRVRLPPGRRFAIFTVQITNRGQTTLELDQDTGDTHDGMQLLSTFGFTRQTVTGERSRFALEHANDQAFDDQPRWKTYPNTRWMSVLGDVGGATFAYIQGHTAPKMVVVADDHLVHLVNEFRLPPDETARYQFGVYLHERTDAPARPTLKAAAERIHTYAKTN